MSGMDTSDLEQVIGLELALLSPQTRRCADQVDDLLDPDFREIGASGRLWTRAEMLELLAEESPDIDGEVPIGTAEMEGSVLGPGLILLTYVSNARGRRARRSSLWRLSGSSWRLLHHQGTLL